MRNGMRAVFLSLALVPMAVLVSAPSALADCGSCGSCGGSCGTCGTCDGSCGSCGGSCNACASCAQGCGYGCASDMIGLGPGIGPLGGYGNITSPIGQTIAQAVANAIGTTVSLGLSALGVPSTLATLGGAAARAGAKSGIDAFAGTANASAAQLAAEQQALAEAAAAGFTHETVNDAVNALYGGP